MRKIYKIKGEFILSIEQGPKEFFIEVLPLSKHCDFVDSILTVLNNQHKDGKSVNVILPVESTINVESVTPLLNRLTNKCSSVIFDIDLDRSINVVSLLELIDKLQIQCNKQMSFSSSLSTFTKNLDYIRVIAAKQSVALFVRFCSLKGVSKQNLDNLFFESINANIKIIEFDRDHFTEFTPVTYRQFLVEIYELHKRNYKTAFVEYFPSWKSALWPLLFFELRQISISKISADQYGCSLGRRTIAFNKKGQISPCGRFTKNARQKNHDRLTISLTEKCFKCPVYSVCEGGCNALSFIDNGTYTDLHCWR